MRKWMTWLPRSCGTARGLGMGVALCAALSLTACGREARTSGTEGLHLTVVGSSTIAPLMSELAKVYEADHPGTRIDVQAGGSSRGVTDVRQGSAGLGMVSRELKPDELDLKRVLIAKDGLALIAHKSNPVASLTKAQVVAIYTGAITNWQQVGGPDLPIAVVSKAEGRSTLEIFSHYFGVKYQDIKAQVVIGDNQQGIQNVSVAPGGIGYVSIGTAEYEAAHGASIRLLSLDGHVPSTQAVTQGSYPITRELNLVFKPEREAELKPLLAMVTGESAQSVITGQFFVPVTH